MQSYLWTPSSKTGVSIASNKECKGIGGSLEEEEEVYVVTEPRKRNDV